MSKKYKVEVVKEGALGTLILGASKIPVRRMEEVMNRYGAYGWDMDFMIMEQHRMFLFWKREAAIITFSKNIDRKEKKSAPVTFGPKPETGGRYTIPES